MAISGTTSLIVRTGDGIKGVAGGHMCAAHARVPSRD